MNNNNAKLGFKQTVYAGYIGYIVQSIVNNLAPLLFLIFRDTYSIPLSKITLIVTVNFFSRAILRRMLRVRCGIDADQAVASARCAPPSTAIT